jgi:hypothetical protein
MPSVMSAKKLRGAAGAASSSPGTMRMRASAIRNTT